MALVNASRNRGSIRARGAFGASAASTALAVALVAFPRPCLAADSPGGLRVTRLAGAEDCADSVMLGAQVGRLVGHDAFDTNSTGPEGEDGRIQVQVTFSHNGSDYAADLIASDGSTTGRRRIVDESATCATLGQAVVATLAVMLDGIGAEGPSTARALPAAPAAPSLPPPAPPRSARSGAMDPDDIPPHGPEEEAPDPEAGDSVSQWYGWQVLVVDLAAIGGLLASFRLGDNAGAGVLGVVSLVTLVGDGAIIHGAHGRAGAAAGSIGLRLGLPLIGGVVADAMAPRCPSTQAGDSFGQAIAGALCPLSTAGYVVEGMGVGLLAASVLDVTLLSWSRAHIRSSSSGSSTPLRIVPVATLIPETERRMAPFLGVVGSF